MKPTIRQESPSDAPSIRAVTVAAFQNAPHSEHTEQFIVEALRRAGALSVSLVAEAGGEIIGHVAVSPVALSDGSWGWHGLGPISVKPAFQGQGAGSLLMREALGQLRRQGAAGCVLLGDPAFYSRFGFRSEPGLVLAGAPPEYFLALSFDSAVPQGTVTYHEAFHARN